MELNGYNNEPVVVDVSSVLWTYHNVKNFRNNV